MENKMKEIVFKINAEDADETLFEIHLMFDGSPSDHYLFTIKVVFVGIKPLYVSVPHRPVTFIHGDWAMMERSSFFVELLDLFIDTGIKEVTVSIDEAEQILGCMFFIDEDEFVKQMGRDYSENVWHHDVVVVRIK